MPLINTIELSTMSTAPRTSISVVASNSPRLASRASPGRGASSHSSSKVAIDDDDDASIRSIRIYIHSLDLDTTHFREPSYCEQPYHHVPRNHDRLTGFSTHLYRQPTQDALRTPIFRRTSSSYGSVYSSECTDHNHTDRQKQAYLIYCVPLHPCRPSLPPLEQPTTLACNSSAASSQTQRRAPPALERTTSDTPWPPTTLLVHLVKMGSDHLTLRRSTTSLPLEMLLCRGCKGFPRGEWIESWKLEAFYSKQCFQR